MASVGETGWPYVQHRGGPGGFVKILDEETLGFADFRGNRQYISVGNLLKDDRVSLFFMDYPNKARLKLFGRVKLIGPDDPATLANLEAPAYDARVERGILIKVSAFDWNCPAAHHATVHPSGYRGSDRTAQPAHCRFGSSPRAPFAKLGV